MGKIFGISDNPVSTIESALRGTVYKPIKRYAVSSKTTSIIEKTSTSELKKNKKSVSNFVIKMRNGFGKLMGSFSKKVK